MTAPKTTALPSFLALRLYPRMAAGEGANVLGWRGLYDAARGASGTSSKEFRSQVRLPGDNPGVKRIGLDFLVTFVSWQK
jgi:hypothetical protein